MVKLGSQALNAAQIAAEIRAGCLVEDADFDQLLPVALRRVSFLFWTPLSVARQVAQWLNELRIASVVDLGSGAGKFCVSTALASECSFTGIEHRAHLLDAARDLSRLFGVDERVKFVHGSMTDLTLPVAQAYYLFNPFGENIYGVDERLGDDVELSRDRYDRDVRFTEAFFDQAPVGTYVITYNDFGGQLPKQYSQVFIDEKQRYPLSMFRKGVSK